MDYRKYCVVSGVFFSLVALAHLYRIVAGIPVQIGTTEVPMLVSWIAVAGPGALAVWAFRLR
ncbi:MAG: hypothetical protein OEM25_06090 [Gammaproteobacteria bacterium]|jgi:hypothetical protein|nr:hypothetical protein [Gammaproteobacteria bacterium]